MNFAGAIFALMRGHKVKRKHWTGYWYKNDAGEVIIHMHTGEEINLKDSTDMIYTLSNCACDDWEIVKEW